VGTPLNRQSAAGRGPLEKKARNPRRYQNAEIIAAQVRRITKIINQVMDFPPRKVRR